MDGVGRASDDDHHGLAGDGRRARYRGTRKNLFDLRRVAVVHNLHIIARQPVTDSYQLAA